MQRQRRRRTASPPTYSRTSPPWHHPHRSRPVVASRHERHTRTGSSRTSISRESCDRLWFPKWTGIT
eukprot:5140936-Prymnesium_polylepis.1